MNDLFYYMDDFIYYYAWLSIVVGILFIPVKSIYNAFCFSKKEHLERSLNNYHPITVSYTHLDVYKRQGL